MISFRPLTARLAARVLRNSLIERAERTVEIAPATTWNVQPPIMLPGESERIIGHSPDSNPATNLRRLTQRTIAQGPTQMHLVRDAYVVNGTILARTAYDRIAPGGFTPLLLGSPEHFDEAALCSTYVTERYFGHWLKDGVCHELLAADLGMVPLVTDSAFYEHRSAYREMLGLQSRQSDFAHIDKLWILEDHETNAHFVGRYQRLRDHISSEPRALKVFLTRGGGIGRHLLNESELIDAFPDFVFIDPRSETETLTTLLSRASIVVSPEGSAISHAAIAMPRGSTLLTIIGAQHFNMPYKVLCDALGIRFALTIADAVDANDFRQPVDRLLKTIDACLTRPAVY